MSVYTPVTTAGTITRSPRRIIAAIAGGALVLSAAAGIGTWQLASRGTSTTAVEQAPSAAPAAPATRVGPADNFLTVNIVGSEEEKLRLEVGLDQVNAINAMRGDLPLENHVVLVAATSEEAARIVRAYSGHQDGPTLPVKFNDFRARAAAPAASAPVPELPTPDRPAFVP